VAITLVETMAESGHYNIDSTTVRAHVVPFFSSQRLGAQMYSTVFCLALLVYFAMAPVHARTRPVDALLPWQAMADCAAAYQANWKDRLSGYNRSPDMSNMIQVQSDDYKATAIRLYVPKT
jgi:hypothetical protein